jgi:PAS domain S-box-containing protein
MTIDTYSCAIYFNEMTGHAALPAESIFDSIASSMEAAIGCFDHHYCYVFVSKNHALATERIYGKKPVAGMPLQELLGSLPHEYQLIRGLWDRVLAGEEFELTSEFGPPGEKRVYQTKYVPIRDANGTVVGGSHTAVDVTDQVKKDVKLERSETIFGTFFNQSPLLMGLVELEGDDIIHVADNPASATFFGRTQADLANKKASDLGVPREVIRLWVEAYRKAELSGVPVKFDYQAGDDTWFRVTASHLGTGESGRSLFSYLIEDISIQKLEDLELRRSLDNNDKTAFARLVDIAPSILYITEGDDGRCSYLSQGWYDFTGQPDRTGENFGWLEAVHPDDLPKVKLEFLSSNEARRPFAIKARFQVSDGHYRWCLDSGNPRFGSNGEFLGYVGSLTDIHQLQQTEDELQLTNEKLKSIFAVAPAGMALLRGPQHIFELTNNSYLDIIGHRQILNRPLAEALPEIRDQGYVQLLDEVFHTGKNVHMKDARVMLQSKLSNSLDEYYFDFSYIQLKSFDGSPYGILIHVLDVTAKVHSRKLTEESQALLQEALRARDEFASVASHELKTPLTSLKLQTQLVQRQHGNGGISQERLERFFSQTDGQLTRLTRLVDDMLDISRMKTGKFAMMLEAIDLCALVHEVVDQIAGQAPEVGTQFSISHDCDELIGFCDRLRIEQVINNLLTNALRYGEGKGIEINLTKLNEMAVVAVRDFGPGISPDNLEKIFERFERGGISANEVSGLGLGLYISRQIARAHGGDVRVESGQGLGSVFYLEIPLFHPA